jgi:hypothetical protein
VIALALAGCAWSPEKVREQQISESIDKPGVSLEQVTRCMTRAFDEKLGTHNNLRVYGETAELIASDPSQPNLFAPLAMSSGALVVVDFRKSGDGVNVTYHLNREVMFIESFKRDMREIINSC